MWNGEANVVFTHDTRLGDRMVVDTAAKLLLDLQDHPAPNPEGNIFHLPFTQLRRTGAKVEIVAPVGPPPGDSPRVIQIAGFRTGDDTGGDVTEMTFVNADSAHNRVEIDDDSDFRGRLTLAAASNAPLGAVLAENEPDLLEALLPLAWVHRVIRFWQFAAMHLISMHVIAQGCEIRLEGGCRFAGDDESYFTMSGGKCSVGSRAETNPELPTEIDIRFLFENTEIDFASEANFKAPQATLADVSLILEKGAEVEFGIRDEASLTDLMLNGAKLTLTDSETGEKAAEIEGSGSGGSSAPLSPAIWYFKHADTTGGESTWNGYFSGGLRSGGSPGKLTVTIATAVFDSALTLEVEVGGAEQGVSYDWLEIVGALEAGGELELLLIDGFESAIQSMDTFRIVTATGGIDGAFANAANGQRVPTADGLGSFIVNYGAGSAYDPNAVVLSDFQPAATGPQPATLNALAINHQDGTIGFTLSGAPDQDYTIRTSIDLFLWMPLSIQQTGPNGTLRVSVPLDPAEPHRFYQALSIVED